MEPFPDEVFPLPDPEPVPLPVPPLLVPDGLLNAVEYDAFFVTPGGRMTGIVGAVLPSTLTVTVELVAETPSVPAQITANSVDVASDGDVMTPLAPPRVSVALPGPITVQLAIFSPLHERRVVVPLATLIGFASSLTVGIFVGVVGCVFCCGLNKFFKFCMSCGSDFAILPSAPRLPSPPSPLPGVSPDGVEPGASEEPG